MLVFVDIQKAYPSVWQDGLFYKLRRAIPHINGHLIELLKKSCITQGETRVFLQGLQSTPYTSCVGVCEGAVESPALFNYFINNSSGRPEGSRVRRHSDLCRLAGCTLCRRHHFGVSDSQADMQRCVWMCCTHSAAKWRLSISMGKTKLMRISNTRVTTMNPPHFTSR
jgi:hypothetical protein